MMVLVILKIKDDYRVINLNQIASIDYVEDLGELRFHETAGDLIVYLDKEKAAKAKVWDKIFMALSNAYDGRGMNVAAVRVSLDLTEFVA
jgi:hypothetical protein